MGEGERATKIALAALGVATAAMGLAGYCISATHNSAEVLATAGIGSVGLIAAAIIAGAR